MRNIPFAFISEETMERLDNVYRDRERAAAVARPLGVPTESVLRNWPEIERHKWLLSEQLGRDVGTQVAALDYLANVKHSIAGSGLNWLQRVWQGLLENLDGDGPRSLVNLEKALRH